MPYNREELLNLPINEKLELVEALWDRIDDDFLEKKMSSAQIEEELDRRLDNLEKKPESLIPWEEVKKKMKENE